MMCHSSQLSVHNVTDVSSSLTSRYLLPSDVQQTVAHCCATLCQLQSVRRSVPTTIFQTLVECIEFKLAVIVLSSAQDCASVHVWSVELRCWPVLPKPSWSWLRSTSNECTVHPSITSCHSRQQSSTSAGPKL